MQKIDINVLNHVVKIMSTKYIGLAKKSITFLPYDGCGNA